MARTDYAILEHFRAVPIESKWIKLREAVQMAFDEKDWMRQVKQAQTGEELMALVREIPKRPLHEMSEEDREFVLMEEKIEAELLALAAKKKAG